MFTTSHGDRHAPVVVLLHGIAASGEDWGKLIPLLTPRYRCVTIDLLGFGKSPKPQWAKYTMEDHLRSLEYTLRKLRLRQPFVLAGHSLGSLLATRYTSEHNGRVSRLLLLSPPVYPPLTNITSRTALRRTDLLMRAYKFLRTEPRTSPANLRRLSRIIPLPRSLTKLPATRLPFFRTLEHCIEQQTIIEDITHITVPVDVFYGSLDSVVIGHNVRALAKLRNVHVHSFRGNHNISRPYAQLVARTLKSF